MAESFQPIAVRSPDDNRLLFWARCLVDLQLATIFSFLKGPLAAARGRLLDVGAGQAPWKGILAADVDYVGCDVEGADAFGMQRVPGIVYYDGAKLPFEDKSFDVLLCVEVLEHVPDPTKFLADLHRVLKPGGQIILTVPWSARLHHLPHDYSRFTRFGLATRLTSTGFVEIDIQERGSDIAVIANKLIVMALRLLRPKPLINAVWTLPLAALVAPMALGFVVASHLALRFGLGSKDDPLGYGVTATKASI